MHKDKPVHSDTEGQNSAGKSVMPNEHNHVNACLMKHNVRWFTSFELNFLKALIKSLRWIGEITDLQAFERRGATVRYQLTSLRRGYFCVYSTAKI